MHWRKHCRVVTYQSFCICWWICDRKNSFCKYLIGVCENIDTFIVLFNIKINLSLEISRVTLKIKQQISTCLSREIAQIAQIKCHYDYGILPHCIDCWNNFCANIIRIWAKNVWVEMMTYAGKKSCLQSPLMPFHQCWLYEFRTCETYELWYEITATFKVEFLHVAFQCVRINVLYSLRIKFYIKRGQWIKIQKDNYPLA